MYKVGCGHRAPDMLGSKHRWSQYSLGSEARRAGLSPASLAFPEYSNERESNEELNSNVHTNKVSLIRGVL